MENKEYSVAVKNIMRGIIDQACLLEETALSEANDKTYEVACFVLQAPLRIRLWRNIFMDAATIVIFYLVFIKYRSLSLFV